MRRFALVVVFLLAAGASARAEPLHEAVDAYALFQSDVTDLLRMDITDESHIGQALALAARHDPERLASGWIAYGALSAAQSPAFVEGVRSRVRAAGRTPVIRQLRRDAAYARNRPPGSAEAIGLILSANAADNARLASAGQRFSGIGNAYASLTPHADSAARETRNTNLRALAGATRQLDASVAARVHPTVLSTAPLIDPSAFGGRRFWDALGNRQSPTPPAFTWRENANAAPFVNRMLTLAGLYIVDATSSEGARVREMLTDRRLGECLAGEQLHLRQCASVSATANEDAHCIARHDLAGPSACMSLAVAP